MSLLDLTINLSSFCNPGGYAVNLNNYKVWCRNRIANLACLRSCWTGSPVLQSSIVLPEHFLRVCEWQNSALPTSVMGQGLSQMAQSFISLRVKYKLPSGSKLGIAFPYHRDALAGCFIEQTLVRHI